MHPSCYSRCLPRDANSYHSNNISYEPMITTPTLAHPLLEEYAPEECLCATTMTNPRSEANIHHR